MTGVIRTVLGNIEPSAAGVVDSHDHLFLSTPALPGDELADESSALNRLLAFGQLGGGMVVQWTPAGLHRNRAALKRISQAAGLHIVAATGRHRKALYRPGSDMPRLGSDQLANLFIDDVEGGSCGFVKVGVGPDQIASDEDDAVLAAARTHHATGVPIAIHLERGGAADLVLRRLLGEGVPATSIVLGHMGRNPDHRRIIQAAESGAWICLDGPSPRQSLTVEGLALVVGLLSDAGHSSQILLGADMTAADDQNGPFLAGPAGLLCQTAPHLRARLGSAALREILIDNPRRAWATARKE